MKAVPVRSVFIPGAKPPGGTNIIVFTSGHYAGADEGRRHAHTQSHLAVSSCARAPAAGMRREEKCRRKGESMSGRVAVIFPLTRNFMAVVFLPSDV